METTEPKKRGRPPKNKVSETNAISMNEKKGNKNNEHYSQTNAYTFGRSRLVNESYKNYGYEDREEISGLLESSELDESNKALRELSKKVYSKNGQVSSTIDFMTDLLTLDKVVTSNSDRSKYQMEDALTKLNYKKIIKDCLFSGLVEGTAFYYVSFSNRQKKTIPKYTNMVKAQMITEVHSQHNDVNIVENNDDATIELYKYINVQKLPTEYCKILSTQNGHYVVAFNLQFFELNEYKILLDNFPTEIQSAYKTFQNSPVDGSWVRLNVKNTIVVKHKSSLSDPWGIPFVAPALMDILYRDEFIEAKRNQIARLNNQILVEMFPQGNEKGTSALTMQQQKEQHQNFSNGLSKRHNEGSTTVISLAAGTEVKEFKIDTSIFENDVEDGLTNDISTALGFASSLLNGSKQGTAGSQANNLNLITSYMYSKAQEVEFELNKIINENYVLEDEAKLTILPTTLFNREKYFASLKTLYTDGRGALEPLISSLGFNVEDYIQLLNYELNQDYDSKYPVHLTSFTTTSKDVENQVDNGRPNVDENDKVNNND